MGTFFVHQMKISPKTALCKACSYIIVAQEAWKEVLGATMKNCFECGVVKNENLMEVEEEDWELEILVRESSFDISVSEYVNIPASDTMMNEIDWQQKIWKDCINPILNQSNVCEETQEILDGDEEENQEKKKKKEKKSREEKLSFAESLAMLDKINKCSFLDGKSHNCNKKISSLKIKAKNWWNHIASVASFLKWE